MSSDWHGLSFAPTGDMFTVSPTWVRIDNGSVFDAGVRVASVEIGRGRQSEFDRVDTGTMTIVLTDRDGVFDPTNTGSPYFGQVLRKPIAFALRDPVADEWWPRFRGVIHSRTYELDPSQLVGRVTITAVDWFDYLANFELAPGHGDFVNADINASGFIFYEDTDFQTRLIQAAADASIPSGLYSFFTGNTTLAEGRYSPGESILTVFMDAIEAEMPLIAQLYVDKYGFLIGHGRYARLSPDSVAATASHWDFNRWKAGDAAAILADPDTAQLRPPFLVTESVDWIRNAALAYPQDTAANRAARMPTQALFENGSIGTHGTRSWSAENLILDTGAGVVMPTTGLDAWDECVLYETFVLDNFASPRNRIDTVTLRSLHPNDARAAATWALMARVDISDIVNVQIGHPGGGGFIIEDFFVEGVKETHTPLGGDLETGYPNTELVLNLSPQSYYNDGSAFPAFS